MQKLKNDWLYFFFWTTNARRPNLIENIFHLSAFPYLYIPTRKSYRIYLYNYGSILRVVYTKKAGIKQFGSGTRYIKCIRVRTYIIYISVIFCISFIFYICTNIIYYNSTNVNVFTINHDQVKNFVP